MPSFTTNFYDIAVFCLLILFLLTGCIGSPSDSLPQLVIIDCSTGVVYGHSGNISTAGKQQFQLPMLNHQITSEE